MNIRRLFLLPCLITYFSIHSAIASANPTASITVDTVDLSAKDFFSSYMSSSEQERKIAEIYLLGVMDSTEGTSWCSFNQFKTTTLRERVYIGLKALSEDQLKNRAATVIQKILSDRYPCRKQP